MSVGIIDPRANPTQLNTVEFLWDPSKRTSVFIQVFSVYFFFYLKCICRNMLLFTLLNIFNKNRCVPPPSTQKVHCISTEFTMRKHGGEKGVPFRIQIDTFKENEAGEYTEHLHSASCQIKVFKVRTKCYTLISDGEQCLI